MKRIRVLVVDDHAVVRGELCATLETSAHIEVVGKAGDSAGAIAAAQRVRPDIVLMDVRLPGLNGIEATRRLKRTLPRVRVLMISIHADDQYVAQSLAAGASGYVTKDADPEILVSAILAVNRGELCIPASPAQQPSLCS